MPKTEAPKTPEQNEKPQKPSPETRVKKNERSANNLSTKIDKKTEEFMNYRDREATRVLDEANRGEEAWHEAHKERNKLTQTERRTEAGKKADKKIDDIRKGKIDGKKRQSWPEDLVQASHIRDSRERGGATVFIFNN